MCLSFDKRKNRKWIVVWPGGVNVRADPDSTAPLIGILPPHKEVIALKQLDEWIFHDQGGWSQTRGRYGGKPLLSDFMKVA